MLLLVLLIIEGLTDGRRGRPGAHKDDREGVRNHGVAHDPRETAVREAGQRAHREEERVSKEESLWNEDGDGTEIAGG